MCRVDKNTGEKLMRTINRWRHGRLEHSSIRWPHGVKSFVRFDT